MDSKHLILQKHEWIRRFLSAKDNTITAEMNIIGHTYNGYLLGFQEAHRTCYLADDDYEFIIFNSGKGNHRASFASMEKWLDENEISDYELMVRIH